MDEETKRRNAKAEAWINAKISLVRQNRDWTFAWKYDMFSHRLPKIVVEYGEWLRDRHDGEPIPDALWKGKVEEGKAVLLSKE